MKLLKKRSVQVGLLILVALIVFIGVYFEPQSALFNKTAKDEKKGEAISNTKPTETIPAIDDNSTTTTIPEIVKYAFSSREHETTGTAYYTKNAEDIYLRIENLNTTNGPDLKVYLATDVDSSGAPTEHISLGDLKANQGDANYLVPSGTDISQYKYVIIWCERFSVSFGDAQLI